MNGEKEAGRCPAAEARTVTITTIWRGRGGGDGDRPSSRSCARGSGTRTGSRSSVAITSRRAATRHCSGRARSSSTIRRSERTPIRQAASRDPRTAANTRASTPSLTCGPPRPRARARQRPPASGTRGHGRAHRPSRRHLRHHHAPGAKEPRPPPGRLRRRAPRRRARRARSRAPLASPGRSRAHAAAHQDRPAGPRRNGLPSRPT